MIQFPSDIWDYWEKKLFFGSKKITEFFIWIWTKVKITQHHPGINDLISSSNFCLKSFE